MNTDDIADKNVEQLQFTGRAMNRAGMLESMQRQQPGSRADGGMEVDPMQATHDMMRKVVETELQLRKVVAHLQNQLASEQEARAHLEKIIRAVADLIVNGSKGQGT